MAGKPGRSGRPRVLPPSELVAVKVPTTVVVQLDVLAHSRDTTQAATVRDLLGVAVDARRRLARAVEALRVAGRQRSLEAEGRLTTTCTVTWLNELEELLLGLYADFVLGAVPRAPATSDVLAMRLYELELGSNELARKSAVEALLREDLELPLVPESDGLDLLIEQMSDEV